MASTWPLVPVQTGFSHNDYTVAWVSPMPKEKAAAMNMFDELHIPPPQPESDQNIYTFGSISGHNVVMACQPDMGLNAAAILATRMNSTFRNIRFGLLVGTAAGVSVGAPDEPTICLGDVVISKGEGRSGGVIVHDHGRKTTNGFEPLSYLDGVPEVLRSAFSYLAAQHMNEDNKIATFISAASDRNPRFKYNFSRPDPSLVIDNLFDGRYKHVNPSDKTCSECDKSRVIRTSSKTDSTIFFGPVASGNQVIVESEVRAKILKAHPQTIAIEMEAAGVMNVSRFATIRGICNYADSHKNNEWHNYASAVAAAVAKEVLSVIPRTRMFAAPVVSPG